MTRRVHIDGCLETDCTNEGGHRLLCAVHAPFFDAKPPAAVCKELGLNTSNSASFTPPDRVEELTHLRNIDHDQD